MNIKTTILTAIAFIGSLQAALTQNLSNKGRDFWVGYGHHQFMEPGQNNSQEMVLYLSAEQAANVTVTIDGTTYIRNYSVPANSVIASEFLPKSGATDARLISLPCSFVPPGFPCGGEGVFAGKGIHIVSDVPIVAYAHIFGSASSGASMLMPVETWGYSYVTLNSFQNYAANCFSWTYAIAQHDNTVIEVTPAAVTRSGKPANVPYTITLMKGQIYQVMAGPETGSNKPEMTGTKIKSIANPMGECWPIAVFAGSSRTSNPQACGSGGGDNDNQQCFPSQAWGKRYLTAPTSNSGTPSNAMTNGYKIAVKDPGTIVTRNGTALVPLANGTYYFTSNTADYIESNKPIMVAQFMTGGGCLGSGGSLGDPEMMYISPIEQGIKRIGFYRNTRENITVNYLTLIIPAAGLTSLRIDGGSTFDYVYDHPRLAGYKVVVKRWSAAQAQAVAYSDSAFTAITYGLGSVESYGYNAGTLINNLSAVGSIFNSSDTSSTTTSHPFTCNNTPVQLSVLLAYQPTRLVWQLSQVGPVLSPNADITDNAPVPVSTVSINGIPYYKYTLPGNYNFSTVGTYTIPLLSTHPSIENCNNTESVSFNVTVNGKPNIDFTTTHTGCVLDTVQFNGPLTSSNGFNLNQWLWTYPDASTANQQNPRKLFTTTGPQNVRLRVVTAEGCVGDTIKAITIFAKPATSFTAVPASICEGGSVSFTPTATYGGPAPINSYYWDFGNSSTVTVPTNAVQTSAYPTYGSYTVKHVAAVSATCPSDTATRIVNVYAKPTTSFTYPAGCLPAGGVVQFTSTATTPDGQAITGHSWNFGDPASGAANVSTLANPTHNYPTFGNYTITYSVTTANGCTKDTTVNATFNISPTFSYPALAPICQSAPGTVSVATATVTNGVTGTGIYQGPGTDAAGNFNPAIAGAGTHTIWYVFTTTANCRDSVSQTITVAAKPNSSFTYSPSACLPASGLVQFTYNGSVSAGQTYLWNFGDPASGAANSSTIQNPTHTYSNTGSYSISLTVTDASGCTDDSVMVRTFSVTPALAYPALAPVCQSVAGTISVATATVTNAVTGTGVYSGPGVDAAGNFNPAVAGSGTHTITYTFTSTGGCIATITQTIAVSAKPTASFTVPTGCLNSAGLAQFTYNGSAGAGQTYLWNFGDPGSGAANTSTVASPTHNYTTSGNYIITVTVTNANGCTDDSTINATFNLTPALSYPALAPVCESVPGTISLASAIVTNGVTGTGVYSGPGTDAAGNFNPTVAGPGTHTITYTFTATGGCTATITQTVTVAAKPNSSFSYSPNACLPASGLVQFTYNGSLSAGQTYTWNFGDPNANAGNPNTSTAQNPTHTYTNTGSYTISLTVTASNGCTDDSVMVRTFSVTPALTWPVLTAVCQGVAPVSVATASVTNNVTGTGVYSGPGTNAAGQFDPTAAGAGTHTLWYVFTSTGNCKDSVSNTITVNPKPAAAFSFAPAGCLPTTGLVQFTYNGSAGAGQTYLWNFGDPNANAGNPNTSTLANPTHNYTNTGSYTISVTASNSFGCTDDSVRVQTFSVTPALAWPSLASLCQNVNGTVSVATATVTNNVTGTGVYSGPGTSSAGQFNPSVAGAGTHTIWYVFTSTGNCKDSVSRTIKVFPKPTSAFTASTSICTNELVQITPNASIPSGTISSWQWYFGDNTTAIRIDNAPFTKQYATHGNYEIKLVAVSDSGCTSDTSRQLVGVHAIPFADFTMPATVCMPGAVDFRNASTVADNSSLTYQWDFNDASPGSTAANPSHTYADSSSYDIKLTVTSEFGCVKDTTKTFDDFFRKPLASFEVTPDTLCQGVETVFKNLSTASNSSIKSQLWIFGDGTISTQFEPVKTFNQPGHYEVKLVISSNENCLSDTFSHKVVVYLQPKIDAGPHFVVPLGTRIQFKPRANDSTTTSFLWTPPTGLSSATALRPTLVATEDQTYTLTATGEGNCTATDFLTVKVLKPVKMTNAFSPNGDGTNDEWVIDNLDGYPGATVEVFNRYGQRVFYSAGYPKAWDGTFKGKPLPVATYYYVINLKNEFAPLTGSITIIR